MPDESWNQDDAWAAPDPRDEAGDDEHWAEDIRTGAAYHMQGYAVSPPQSGLGIASLVLSVLSGVMLAIAMFVSALIVWQNPNAPQADPQLMGAGCGMIIGMMLAVLAGIVGVVALFQPDRSKTCAVLGAILAGVEVLGIIGLIAIGLMFGP